MKLIRHSLVVAVLLVASFGLQSTTSVAASATVAPPTHSANGCCWVYLLGRWYCIPC